MIRTIALPLFVASLLSTPALAAFEKVRCDGDIPKALIGQRIGNEPVSKIEARHKALGLEDLGGEEASARVFSSSWKICGREFALLQRSRANGGKGDAITDVIAFPEHSRTAPAFAGVQCERDGKPLKAYVIGVLENPATTTSKLLPATHAWRVDERSGKFVKLDVAGLRCSRDDIPTRDGGL